MKTKQKKRNGHACHPIMRKGGVHETPKSSERRKEKKETERLVGEWRSRSLFCLIPESVTPFL
jgi:hypothetical protein